MIRVLYVSTSTTLGGAEKTLYTLATRLDSKKIAVPLVVSLKPLGFYGRKLSESGVPVMSLGTGRLPGPLALKTLKALIAQHKPDVVHAFMYQAVQFCRLVKFGAQFKLVSSPRVTYRTRSWVTLALDRFLKDQDDVLIAECEASRKYLIERQGYAPGKVKTIYNGIDPNSRVAQEDIQRLRNEAGATPGDFLIGAVGRLDRQKNHAVLVQALAQLGTARSWRCVIIGDGPERTRLEALIRRLNLQNRMRILGERLDAAAWLASLDLFVLPSLWEGLPNVLLEAMSAGIPCAASAVDGVAEIIRDEENGFLFPPDDTKALARKLSGIMENDSLRRQAAAAGQVDVSGRFSLPAMLSSYGAAYESLS